MLMREVKRWLVVAVFLCILLTVGKGLNAELPSIVINGMAPDEKMIIPVMINEENGRLTKAELVVTNGIGHLLGDVPTTSSFSVTPAGNQWWASPDCGAFHSQEDAKFDCRFWKTAPLVVSYRTDDSEKPQRVKIAFCGCPSRKGGPPSQPCGEAGGTVVAKTVTAWLPSSCLDIEVLASSYAPVAYVEVLVGEPGEHSLNLRTAYLRKGGSIAGRIFSAVDGLPLEGVTVRARMVPTWGPARITVSEALSNSRGRFRVSGLADSLIDVEVHADGYAPTKLDGLEVKAGSEINIGDVSLSPPASLTILVEPPVFGDDSWNIALFSQGRPAVEQSAATDPSGQVTFQGIPPGTYDVVVQATVDGRLRTFSGTTVTVGFGDHVRVSLQVELCTISGRVLFEDDGVFPLRLVFASEIEWAGITKTQTDVDGDFNIILPGHGLFEIRVNGTDLAFSSERRIDRCPGEIEIEVPSTGVSGIVVNDHDSPQPGAKVIARQRLDLSKINMRPEESTTIADQLGEFRFRALTPGIWELQGSSGRSESDVAIILIAENSSIENQKLTLNEMQAVTVRVSSASIGPVTGATVVALWDCTGGPQLLYRFHDSGRTGHDGTATFQVPSSCREIVIVALAQDWGLDWSRQDPSREINIRLPESGARLVLRRQDSQWLQNKAPFVMLRHNGVVLPVVFFLAEIGSSMAVLDQAQRQLSLWNLGPGEYEVIVFDTVEGAQAYLDGGALGRVASKVSLLPGATVSVDLP